MTRPVALTRITGLDAAAIDLLTDAELSEMMHSLGHTVYHYGGAYPSSGATLDYAYALIVLLCGGGPLLFKNKAADYKSLISK